MCTALPTLASTRFPRLYELSSLVRAALINMGSVLAAKSTVETEPASIATLDMSTKLRRLALDARRARHPFLEKHPMGEFPYEAAAATSSGDSASITWTLQSLQRMPRRSNWCEVRPK